MHARFISLVFVFIIFSSVVSAVPVEKTKYGKAPLRLEARPDPLSFVNPETTADMTQVISNYGVNAQWISVVDPNGNPYYKSQFLPTTLDDLDKREQLLKNAVKEIHKQGMAAISWYSLILSASSWKNQPEWRQQYLSDPIPGDQQEIWCCINSGYGDALIDFCNEAIEKFDLDGIWFDGSAFTEIWHRPLPYSCICSSCKKLFKEQTGLEIPTKADWNDPVFRRWVAWRYDVFSSYIGRVASEIRREHPKAAVVLNHYHRPLIPWQGAIPLNPYKADIITGSEGSGEKIVDLTMRLCRAYRRPQSEVWTHLDYGNLIHHALTNITAGGYPSYGGNAWDKGSVETLKIINSYLSKLSPYISGSSIPYAAIHVSQQTETFYLSRDRKGLDWEMEPFWSSLIGWTQGLMQSHISPDYIYDKSLTLKNLKKYKVFIMPISFALSDQQCKTALKYAEQGGTLILGPWTGIADEWGELKRTNIIADKLGFNYKNTPSYAATERKAVTLINTQGENLGTYPMLHADTSISNNEWEVLYYSTVNGEDLPCIIQKKYGKGRVILSAVDMADFESKWTIGADGDTSIAPTDETAAVGKRSMKFIDGPNTAHVFYPDLEMHHYLIDAAVMNEGRFSCWLKLDKDSNVVIENRDNKPVLGTYVNIKGDGSIYANDEKLGEIETDRWFRIEIRFRLTGDNKTYDVHVQPQGSQEQIFKNLIYKDEDFARCNWTVLYGDGTDNAVFYADEIKIEAVSNDKSMLVFYDGFEEDSDNRINPVSYLCNDLLKTIEPDIEVEAPPSLRMGAFRKNKDEIIVHLHNINGSEDGKSKSSYALIKLKQPITSVRLLFADKEVPVIQRDGRYTLYISSIPMMETVIIKTE